MISASFEGSEGDFKLEKELPDLWDDLEAEEAEEAREDDLDEEEELEEVEVEEDVEDVEEVLEDRLFPFGEIDLVLFLPDILIFPKN